ncbi:MAG: alpha/beta hydrolase [Alphaproteobacteria bacterium]|nr:alpha/beta hydrolase [Alphaproteobacteria bacterium]MBU6472300.1 alpha/beta hydrolase [Alphaproteobacteria bacterium]MDE2011588.1 alpha/beta hydrolase [Alphaproteobacteria bacterium]MDE2071934.1 alpha/beta hydrolase [Alphaproteobacteria bacterium]MDE2353056.1 alpha/beta hydrolase [Alphaproteobacteria bacterium]
MPLDPILKALLDQMAAEPRPPIHEMEPAQAREMMSAMSAVMAPRDVPIGKVEDIAMPGEAGEIALRVYTPVAAGGKVLPALVFYHGGGWVIGDLDSHDGICRILANEAGVRVIAVDYRLAPEHKFPAAVNDAVAAVNWVEANASVLGVDANRIAVGGDSAGGALAAVVAQTAKANVGPRLLFQLLICPATQIGEDTGSMRKFAEGYFLERAGMQWFYGHYVPEGADPNDPRLSPLRAADVSGLPPAYMLLAGFDPLYDEGLAYATKMRAAGVPVTVADHPDMVHDFVMMHAVVPRGREALQDIAAALKAALEG